MNNYFSQRMPKVPFIFILIIIFCLAACGVTESENTQKSNNETLPEEKNSVGTIVLVEKDFMQEIVSNGKLSAIQRAELFFKNTGFIETISVKNGQKIKKETEIAKLQNESYQFALRKAELTKEKAEIDKLDARISMGYSQNDKTISPDHKKIANIRSGFHQAQIQFDEAKLELERTILTAPFSGTIASIKQNQHEKANLAEPFCSLINDSRFFINFPLLETEIAKVNIGQKVIISPIAGAQQTIGTVTEINPCIDKNGLVWLKAEVKNPGGYIEGMNVKVSINKAISNKLVVPKQSVVLRQNREVLFRYTHGTAYWTYIEVLDENEKEYSVTAADGATLELGDTVIITNNLNLAHESEVEIIED